MTDSHLELKVGAQVHATDGLFGHVHHVILSPLQNRVVGLVVRARLLPPSDWAIPIELIADASDTLVKLRVSREDILKQIVFDPSQLLPVAGETPGYEQGQALVSIHGGAGGSDELARKLEEKIDEALEESFPASDPPFWMPTGSGQAEE